ncbi:DUF4232 domain-containing protein [Streptosporangium sp. NPDC005286]|uniref:DUF4232 domain-containing protein n=1 Tax=Streptosporangium sp. NPDC005286 TaxID=3154463 RepID=UPI0033B4E37A
MKHSIGAGLLAATSALAMLAAATACALPASRARSAAPAAGSAPASFSPASPSSAPARPAVAVQAAGLRVADSGTAAGRCRAEALAARVGRVDAGAGQRYAPLVFTNTSSGTCWVYGFVGLIMIDGSGDAMRTRTRRESVQPRRITLRPGASAHARLHWSEVPGGSRSCPASARLMIIPPDEVAHLEIPFKAAVCDDGRLDVTPMASGARL